MKPAQLIYRWQRCEKLAADLKMNISTNTESLYVQGNGEPGAHASIYGCDTVDELLGYLEGVADAKSKHQNAALCEVADKARPN